MPGSSILSDIRVLDLTSFIFGPYCTQTLADMGADVVKVETEHGDVMRTSGKPAKTRKMGPQHLTLNRGKRSVVFDLTAQEGKEALKRLLATSDVFIHNVRVGGIERLGLSYQDVKAIKPDIVYVECLGFGADGPYADRPAFDDVIQAYSGMASLSPRLDGSGKPRFLPSLVADKVSGLHAAYATLAALRHRDQTGEPVFVEVPMFECVTHFLLEEHFAEATFDPPVGDYGFKRSFDDSLQPMQTKDGWLMIAPYTDERWVAAFEVIGAIKELEDERLNDRKKRYFNQDYKHERLAHHLRKETTAHWMAAFDAAQIPVGKVNTLEELQSDAHLQAVSFFQKREHPSEGDYWEIQPPVRFNGEAERELTPAPQLGEHTNELLTELGLAAAD